MRHDGAIGRRAAAIAGSFGIYLFPLIGPHAAWLLGEHLYAELTRSFAHRSAVWLAADFAAALAAQAALAMLLAWTFARRGPIRFLALLGSLPVFFLTLEWLFLLAIPSYFLIEDDVAPETSSWVQECFLPDVSLAAVQTPPGLPLERAGRAWIITGPDARSYALLESCARTLPLDLAGLPSGFTAPRVLADGKALFAVWDKQTSRNTWWLAAGVGAPARPLDREPVDPDRSPPVLSDDGEWIAWKEYVPGETVTPLPERIVIRSIDDRRERVVRLPAPGGVSRELLGFDATAASITLFVHDYGTRASAIETLGFDGEPRGRPIVLEGVAPQSTTFLRVGAGWIAWDAYREDGRYRLAWTLPQGRGATEVPLGRSITAVGADPTGSYIALSTTTALNIGRIRDAVYVLRTRDGKEVFRRYLPTYTRSRVTFLGSSRFAYDDREGAHFGIRILRLPDEKPPS